MLLEFILVGFLGGLVRALYGLLKAVNDGAVVNKSYFLITLVISAVIGGLLGSVFTVNYQVAALAGYVGTDMLENIVKDMLPSSLTLKKNGK